MRRYTFYLQKLSDQKLESKMIESLNVYTHTVSHTIIDPAWKAKNQKNTDN